MFGRLLKWFFIRFLYIKIRRKHNTKKALISFIIHPFFKKSGMHPNELELKSIIETLTHLGYDLTIVDYRRKSIHGKFDLVIGFGECYEYCLKKNKASKYILYSTGSPSLYQNAQSAQAFNRFILRNPTSNITEPNCYLRFTENTWIQQLIMSDAIITIGNEYIRSLFKKYNDNVYIIPPEIYHLERKHVIAACNNNPSFIWFGGKGTIHKGLDLCVDVALEMGIKLYIAGPIDKEINIYSNKINNTELIEYVGLIDLNDVAVYSFLSSISFCILPSCSEAAATSVVTLASNFGIIPIIPKEVGIDLDDTVIEITNININALKNAIEKALSLSTDELKNMRERVRYEFSHKFIKGSFQTEFECALDKVLNLPKKA